MSKRRIISLDHSSRLLKKARDCLADVDLLMADTTGAVSILLDALPHADAALKQKMLPLLGYAGKDRVLWPLYNLMVNPSTDDQTRCSAAVQLGLAASLSDDPKALKIELIENLNHHPDATVRCNCALALGWRGNRSVVNVLIKHLQDPDRDVQTAVVVALSSVGDDRVFDQLVAHLGDGSLDLQRSIILNLWRFHKHASRVQAIYQAWLNRADTDLHADVTSALGMLPLSPEILNLYRRLLSDADSTIRQQVVENLSSADPDQFESIQDNLQSVLKDTDARVRQAAVRLFSRR